MPCDVCHSPSKDLLACAWPTARFVVDRYMNLQPGDRVRRYGDAEGKKAPARVLDLAGVVHIDPLTHRSRLYIKVHLLVGKTREKTFVGVPTSRVRVERDNQPCGQVCCELCRQERAEDKAVCKEHWKSWESVP